METSMETLQADPQRPGWVKGWMVVSVKRELPGDFVDIHAHAAQAQADAVNRGPGHQVFHGSHHVGTGDFIVD